MIGLGSSVAPASAPAAIEAAYALLAIIADPAAHKARLDALVAAKAEAEARLDAIAGEQAALAVLREKSVAAETENRQASLDARNAQAALAVAKNDLSERERAFQASQETAAQQLAARSTELDARMTAMNAHEAALTERESAVAVREQRLAADEADVASRLEDARNLQAEYSLKLAELKKITG